MPELENCYGQHSVIVTIAPRLSRSLLHHTSLLINNILYPYFRQTRSCMYKDSAQKTTYSMDDAGNNED